MQRSTTIMAAEKRQSTPKKFDFRSFMKLISTIHPHYWQLGLGLLFGISGDGRPINCANHCQVAD